MKPAVTHKGNDAQRIIEVIQLFITLAGKQVLKGFDLDLYEG